MEKRRKNISIDILSSEDVNNSNENVKLIDSSMKSKSSMSPTVAIFGLLVLIAIYFVYTTIKGSNKNLPSLTVHIPSYKEDINIHIPSIQKDALPIIEQIRYPIVPIDTNTISNPAEQPKQSSEEELQSKAENLLEEIRKIKIKNEALEYNPQGLKLKLALQAELRKLIPLRYGQPPYLVEMKLKFPETMPDYTQAGQNGTIVIKLAPYDLIPYSVYYFLELIRKWKGGWFHRNADHVLQSMLAKLDEPLNGLAFQEYHPDYPHTKLTMGYAGRPGGPPFYINIIDNTHNHGPGKKRGAQAEADSCFGKILSGEDIVERMKKQPGATKPYGFIKSKKDYITITSLKLLQ